jgi:hypothetical protein
MESNDVEEAGYSDISLYPRARQYVRTHL